MQVGRVLGTKKLIPLCLLLSIASANTASAQNVNDFLELFGGLAQSAMNKEAARREWRQLPSEERDCIDQALLFKGGSVKNLIQGGIRPSDRRLSEIRSHCQDESRQTDEAASPAPHETALQRSPYVVDGLALGERVNFGSAIYSAYECNPSDQFPGFTWCQRKRQEARGRQRVLLSNSILHGSDGTAAYINRSIQPAFLRENEVKQEMGRLSSRFGESARTLNMPVRQGLPQAVIASWGKVKLVEIDAKTMSFLAAGESPRAGLLVDFLGDLQKSAKLGLPVYRLSGGAGYVWNGSFDRKGIGHLRFLAVDTSALSSEPVTADQQSTPTKRGQGEDIGAQAMHEARSQQTTSGDDGKQAVSEPPQPPSSGDAAEENQSEAQQPQVQSPPSCHQGLLASPEVYAVVRRATQDVIDAETSGSSRDIFRKLGEKIGLSKRGGPMDKNLDKIYLG